MTDSPPVAASGPLSWLPDLLLRCSVVDFELDYLLDEAGKKVEPHTFKLDKILGFDMRRLSLPLLRDFCLLNGVVNFSDNATQSSLLVALAKKKINFTARLSNPDLSDTTDEDDLDEEEDSGESVPVSQSDGKEDGSGESAPVSQSNGSCSEQVNTVATTNPSDQTNHFKTATLDDVNITEARDAEGNIEKDDQGATKMIATSIKGVVIRSIKADVIRAFCTRHGIRSRGKTKREGALLIAYTKQMDGAIELNVEATKQTTQQKINMKFRLLNACFTDQYYEKFVSVNKRKTRAQIDSGTAGNSQGYYAGISAMVNEAQNNDTVGFVHFPDNEHLVGAIADGLDLNSFIPTTWPKAKILLSEVFKEHELAKARYTKSGNHQADFYGNGFTKDLAAYYFFLLLQGKPEAFKSVSTTLDEGVFYVAGTTDGGGHVKRPSASLEKKEKKAARQTEENVRTASAIIQPMMDTFCKTQKESEDRREDRREARVIQGQQVRDANNAYDAYLEMGRSIDSLVVALSKETPGDLVYNHLENRIEESKADRQALKAKSGRF